MEKNCGVLFLTLCPHHQTLSVKRGSPICSAASSTRDEKSMEHVCRIRILCRVENRNSGSVWVINNRNLFMIAHNYEPFLAVHKWEQWIIVVCYTVPIENLSVNVVYRVVWAYDLMVVCTSVDSMI